ncbi:FAD:protein FMN transferase [Paenibacillus sp. ACRRX]|uniref:FAD:protein FMN transferase n=1 Tax=unclassified Paenibacillus TaxID=185978 RepID=UPI001EF4EC44|nr:MULTISPECIES: FAD:protein FMN transferase [unclassified Paenibacillus]MCG7410337.1 FAD:protein FMN transferase [Paenibacillus sp. ACRRX]MDK8181165.1 FAD:protein FMN transferase [Paenibacillus sp. UMB4589-SE434]
MNKKTAMIGLGVIILVIAALFAVKWNTKEVKAPEAAPQPPAYQDKSYFIFDTVVNIKIYDKGDHEHHFQEIDHIMKSIDSHMSRTKDNSELAAVNEAAGKSAVRVSADTFEAIELSVQYGKETDGLFDPSVGPLVNLWNIGHDNAKIPDKAELQAAIHKVNYKNIELNGADRSVRLTKPGMVLDLGGIGKGYAADRVADYLKAQGIKHALVNLGGSSIVTIGEKPNGSAWVIGIQNPDKSRGTQIGTIKLKGETIDSSGVYERFFMKDGVRYHHLLNPKTGYPEQNELMSVTIIADNATDSDALSTAVFLEGLEEGLKHMNRIAGMEAFFITNNKDIYVTDGLKGKLNITDPEFKVVN